MTGYLQGLVASGSQEGFDPEQNGAGDTETDVWTVISCVGPCQKLCQTLQRYLVAHECPQYNVGTEMPP